MIKKYNSVNNDDDNQIDNHIDNIIDDNHNLEEAHIKDDEISLLTEGELDEPKVEEKKKINHFEQNIFN